MKRLAVMITISAMMFFAGCNKTESAAQPDVETDSNKPTIILKEKEEVEEKTVYGVGDRVQVREDYAVTLVGVTELDPEEHQYDKDDQVILIELMFENISMDRDHPMYKLESRQTNGYDFGIRDGSYMVPDSKSPYFGQTVKYTPVGTKSLQRYVYRKENREDSIEIAFGDYLNESTEFNIKIGEHTAPDFDGTIPVRDDAYKLGEPLLLAKAKNDYTVTIDSVKKLEGMAEKLGYESGAVYEVTLTHSNYSLEKMGNYFDMVVVDEKGNTGYQVFLKYEGYPREVEGRGLQRVMHFVTHTDSEKLLLFYYDGYNPEKRSYFIEVEDIK
ncbi:MAG TPA: hypothetical protein DHM90_02535 [Clostridiaceae bacterium]|nr:hypothetical protein [Clostridiaceae bacterium]